MRPPKIILDTGPLVAYFNKNDMYHEWTIAQVATMKPPLLTCEAVLSEASFLLRRYENGIASILDLLDRELLSLPFRLDDELKAIKALVTKYADLPMSLADACLVRMAELTSNSVILTLDRHFRIYRKDKRKILPTIMPEDQ